MPAVATPTGAEVMTWTGLTRYVTAAADDTAFQSDLVANYIPTALVRVALKVGESTYDSTSHTQRVADALERAVAYQTAAMWLRYAQSQQATGTHQPLLMIEADELQAALEAMEAESDAWIALATAGIATRPFARPTFGASTFNVTSSDRLPSERNTLLDGRDDIDPNDLDNG